MSILSVIDIKHTYQDGSKKNKVLNGINAKFEKETFYAILGESGSGKTTLLSLIAGLDSIQEGDIHFEGTSIKDIGYDNYRLKKVNIIFQSYNLIPYMTAVENVMVAVDIAKMKIKDKKDYCYKLLGNLGIDKETAQRTVLKLSGGEQQRVAVARALSQDVPIILADEPTGNLDEDTEEKIIDIFKELKKQGKCVIVVTHSKKIASQADVVYCIKKGMLQQNV